MAAQANIVLFNGATTPVSKTFVPLVPYGGSNQPAVWLLKEGVSPLSHVRIEIGMKRNAQGVNRVYPKIIVPQVALIDSVPTLINKAIFDAQSGGFIIPADSLQTQINDLYAYTTNLVGHAVMASFVRDNEPAY